MDEQKLREWVERKLDQGISEERIKKSLRNTGHDPSIVDEVQDPFGGDKVQETEDFSTSDTGSEDSSTADNSISIQGSGEDPSEDFASDQDSGDKEAGGVSMPAKPDVSMPSVSFPDLSLRAAAVLVGIIIAVGGYLLVPASAVPDLSTDFQVSMPDVSIPDVSLPDFSLSGSEDQEESSSGTVDAGCDVGVRINSISTDGRVTDAEVFVTRGTTDVVLEVYSGESLQGSSVKRIGGEGLITVGATGDRAVLHPEGCEEPSTSAPVS